MNRLVRTKLALGLLAGTLAAGCASTAKLSAADVVAKNAAARGGLDAWRKVQTMVGNGHLESARAPAPGMLFELQQKRPNKTRLQITAMGERSLRVFDGSRGWKLRATGGQPQAEPYTLPELRSAQASHGIDGPLIDAAARGNSVTLEGVDRIADRKAYHLAVHLARGGTEDVWVDAETYLDIRYDRMVDGPAGASRRVSVTYGDYRTVEGVKIPFLITTGGGPGVTPDKMQIERVLLNPSIDDSAFGNPAAPRPRNRMLPGVMARASVATAPGAAPGIGDERGSAAQ